LIGSGYSFLLKKIQRQLYLAFFFSP